MKIRFCHWSSATAVCDTAHAECPRSPSAAVIDNHASPKSHLMTDEASAFEEIGQNLLRIAPSLTRRRICAARRRRVITTNTVEGFFSILKRGIYGVQHVSEAHLHRYLAEFDFRYSNREKLGVNDTPALIAR